MTVNSRNGRRRLSGELYTATLGFGYAVEAKLPRLGPVMMAFRSPWTMVSPFVIRTMGRPASGCGVTYCAA